MKKSFYLKQMKILFALLISCICLPALCQTTAQNIAKDTNAPERKAILDAIKQAVKPNLKLTPKLVVRSLTLKNGFAYFAGQVKTETGKDIDFRKTAYRDYVEQGIFDGDGTNALLKKNGANWKVLAVVIGPTDVPWGCWWKDYKAPKEIFDYTEKTCR